LGSATTPQSTLRFQNLVSSKLPCFNANVCLGPSSLGFGTCVFCAFVCARMFANLPPFSSVGTCVGVGSISGLRSNVGMTPCLCYVIG
jgi:hypothetical protein